MTQYHINAAGEAGVCRVKTGVCPFGGESGNEDHYPTRKAAQEAYEASQGGSFSNVGNAERRTQSKEQCTPKPKMMKVYRVGSMTPPEKHGFDGMDEKIAKIDSFAPEGRQGRAGAIFASPDLASHSRWVKGVSLAGVDTTQNHEITVDPEKVYVYSVEAYERASSDLFGREEQEKRIKDFWESGKKLSDYSEWAKENNPAPGTYELLLSTDSAVSIKPLSPTAILKAAPEHQVIDVQRELFPQADRAIMRKPDLKPDEAEVIADYLPEKLAGLKGANVDNADLAGTLTQDCLNVYAKTGTSAYLFKFHWKTADKVKSLLYTAWRNRKEAAGEDVSALPKRHDQLRYASAQAHRVPSFERIYQTFAESVKELQDQRNLNTED